MVVAMIESTIEDGKVTSFLFPNHAFELFYICGDATSLFMVTKQIAHYHAD